MGSIDMFPTEIQGSHFYFRLSSKTENEPTNYAYSFILLPYIRSSYCLQLWMQDSLGGNSKTTIIANVSPSIWYVSFLELSVFFLSVVFFFLNKTFAFLAALQMKH